MYRLDVNPATLAFAKQHIPHNLEALQFLTEQLLRTSKEVNLYNDTPQPASDIATVQQLAADKNGDWARIVHPHVLAQIVVDMAEALSVPIPDNVPVWLDNDWRQLAFVQPTPPAPVQQAAPTLPPAPTPAPAPVAAPAPAPATPSMSLPQVMAEAQPDALAQMAAPPPSAAQSAQPAATHVPQEQAATTGQAVDPAPQNAAQSVPGTVPSDSFGFNLPSATMIASKGANPLAKDPGGVVPKSAPARYLRDMADMAPHLFSMPAGDIVGKGKGQLQRQRVLMALFSFADQILASVPDGETPVALLRHQLAHQRYNASVTPGGPTMLAWEAYLLAAGAEDGE